MKFIDLFARISSISARLFDGMVLQMGQMNLKESKFDFKSSYYHQKLENIL